MSRWNALATIEANQRELNEGNANMRSFRSFTRNTLKGGDGWIPGLFAAGAAIDFAAFPNSPAAQDTMWEGVASGGRDAALTFGFWGSGRLIAPALRKFFASASARSSVAAKNVDNYLRLVDELDVSTAHNGSVFYSGRGNRELAEAFASQNGRTTLEMTPGGKFLDD